MRVSLWIYSQHHHDDGAVCVFAVWIFSQYHHEGNISGFAASIIMMMVAS
jgi:hypothetical protein